MPNMQGLRRDPTLYLIIVLNRLCVMSRWSGQTHLEHLVGLVTKSSRSFLATLGYNSLMPRCELVLFLLKTTNCINFK